jgi:hypothetical protein
MNNEIDFYNTNKNIYEFSDPNIVQKRAYKLLGKEARIIISPKKDKKYRIYNPLTNKYVDFGYYGMEDYTKHKDKERQRRFKLRNKKWANSEPYTPSFLSYYLLW